MARVLFIRQFPPALHKKIKVEAALQGTTIKKVVQKACSEYLKKQEQRREQNGNSNA